MRKLALHVVGLAFFAFFALVVAAGFVHATPPGGVAVPYHVVVLLIPLAVYWYADRLSIAVCYGFACGVLFAWPVYVDGRTGLRAMYGTESQAELVIKILAYAAAITLTCVGVYIFKQSQINYRN
jgi:hypothetical protein